MAEHRNLLDMVNSLVNTFWKKTFSQNAAVSAASEIRISGMLNRLGLTWLPSYAPGFYLNSRQVTILHEPHSFYKLLIEEIGKAQKRIVLASLYLGNGSLEESLIAALKKRLEEKSDLKVKILLDCTRGSRGKINSRKIILPMLKEFEKSCQVSLYQTPFLRGPLVPFVPEKYKEIVGLQHIKLYLFDNNVVITGANLSNDYFTKRQDRYMFISGSSELSDFLQGLVDKVSEFSFHLNGNDDLSLSKSWPHNPLKSDPDIFNFAASTHIKNYYESFLGNTVRGGEGTRMDDKHTIKENMAIESTLLALLEHQVLSLSFVSDDDDTIIFPLIEMGPLGIHVDSKVTTKVLEECGNDAFVHLTSGYFNLTQSYINTIINRSKAQFHLLMAHPMANGFYKAKGPAGGVPHAYTTIALQFLDKVIKSKQISRIKMLEYKRPGWTYHAKGLWLSSMDCHLPFLTMIGSPNFGERSVKRDLECQFLLATTNENLQRELLRERHLLYEFSEPFTKDTVADPERKTPFWVEVVVWLFRSYL